MLFMHQACVFETPQQYVKSNEILTEVIKEAYQLGRIDDCLKDAIQAFQLKMIGKQDITLDATDDAIAYLAKKGYQPEFGARPVKRVIQKEVLNQLSREILAGKITTDSIILLDAFDEKLVFRNQSDLVEK